MIEQWKAVGGFEGRYEASDQGRVRSVPHLVHAVSKAGLVHQRMSPGKVLRPGKCRDYLIVNLSGYGTIAVHILVARAFVAGRAPGLEVNHRDGVKANCAASNLEWVTKVGNQEHAVTTGLNTQAITVEDPLTGARYESIARAARLAQVSHKTIRRDWARV